MVIKKRPIITWLLCPEPNQKPLGIYISGVSSPTNADILYRQLVALGQVRLGWPQWGLPELLTPSFEKAMRLNAPAHEKSMPMFYEEFSRMGECGILLYGRDRTIVYRFDAGVLHIWHFKELADKSAFTFYCQYTNVNGQTRVGVTKTIIEDSALFQGTLEERQNSLASVGLFVITYVAVKKYGKVETVLVPQGKSPVVEGSPLEFVDKKKIINNSGQKVVVMDSRWFRKIVNDNDIYVRGFWRRQKVKNEFGELCTKIIFIKPFIRRGYHRNAKIEESE